MKSRKFLVTCFLVVVLSLCFAAAAFASPETPAAQDIQVSDPTLQVEQIPGPAGGGEQAGVAALQEGQVFSGATDNKDTKHNQKVPESDQVEENTKIIIGQAVSAESKDHPEAVPSGQNPVLGVEIVTLSAEEQLFYALVNQERAALGLRPLEADSSLVKVARVKAQDMVDNRYFDHNSPTYGSPFDMLKRFGISYSFAGENLAMAPSVASAHKALMESPGHRANILNGNFDRVGIGIVVTGGYRYCVQLFTGGQRETPVNNPGGSVGSGQPPQPQQPQPGANAAGLSADEALMIQLINQERARAGVPQLVPDELLFKVARLKAQDFVDKNYFAHTSPTYGSVRDMLARFGVKYVNYAENLALASSATRAHTGLMNSPGNRANILSPKFQRVGIGVAVKGSYKYYVQLYTDGGVQQPPSTEPPKPPATGTNPGQPGTTDPNASGLTADEQRMLSLVNAERARNGLAPLRANLKVTQVARLKAKDMIAKNYFSHTSPTYGSPFDMMRQFGVTYRTAGENLAGAPAVDVAHTNLMNSPGHRANILNGNFKEVGIGILSGSPYGKIFVQMFIG